MRFLGVKDIINIWVAINDQGKVIKTTGLYRYLNDEKDAGWLFWFCVAPEERGKGVGKQLLLFSIDEAKKSGAKYLRLYTSDAPDEKKAQMLYEKYGLMEKTRQKKLFWTKIVREMRF